MTVAASEEERFVPDGGTMTPGAGARLSGTRCPACGRVEFPRRARCPACRTESEPYLLSSEGVLVGFTSVLHPPPGARVDVPYWVGVARFSDDLCVMGLLELPIPEELSIGLPLTTVVLEPADGLYTYGFRIV
jgi:uncharacterized OB-fold protein